MTFMHYDEERRMCVKTDVSVVCVVCSGFIGAKRDNGKNDIIKGMKRGSNGKSILLKK